MTLFDFAVLSLALCVSVFGCIVLTFRLEGHLIELLDWWMSL